MFDRGAKFLIGRLKKSAGILGRYVQDGRECECKAIPGGISSAGDIVENVALLDTDRDWIFDPRDLVIDGLRITPREGDRWLVTIDGTERWFEVLPPEHGERGYAKSDQLENILRVFMKYRGET